jgi:hypothetical protein
VRCFQVAEAALIDAASKGYAMDCPDLCRLKRNTAKINSILDVIEQSKDRSYTLEREKLELDENDRLREKMTDALNSSAIDLLALVKRLSELPELLGGPLRGN